MLTIGSRVLVRRWDAAGEHGTITQIDPATDQQRTVYHVRLNSPVQMEGLFTRVLWLDAEALEEVPPTDPTEPT